MKNLSFNEELHILEVYDITPNELFAIRSILLAQEGEMESLSMLFNVISLRKVLESLKDKGIIKSSYKIPETGTQFNPTDVDFNKIFLKGFYKSSFEIGKELFETYPMFGNINGAVTPLRGVSKKFSSLEDFYIQYGKAIKWDPELHKNIINLVIWAKNNTNYIQFSLASFLIDKRWEELQALKDGNIVNINFDTVTVI